MRKARIILAREKRGLLRATLSKDGKSVSDVTVINDTLLECRGLLFAHDSLYANANNSKALYRLRDTNGDDTFDSVTKLKATGGGVGHGRNDLALGPDGMIYLIHGDSVEVPQMPPSSPPPPSKPSAAKVTSSAPTPMEKSGRFVASGLRNPFGIDFNPDGEIFTYDADNESDIGLPFYRPTRVNHLVSGADYGWRQGGQSWPVHAPDSLPTTVDIGHGSPTAVKFGTRSHFPNKYREALFILDWAYGRIIAVHTIPRGASYTCRSETFLRGRPLNVTDLDFGPDGAMYFVTGGRKTRSALYRVRYTGPSGQPVALTEQENARIAFSEKARELRRSLEKFHGLGQPADALSDIWAKLDHPDPWIRHAARTALEHQPVGRWQDRTLTEPPSPSAAAALLALSRVGARMTFSQKSWSACCLSISQSSRHPISFPYCALTKFANAESARSVARLRRKSSAKSATRSHPKIPASTANSPGCCSPSESKKQSRFAFISLQNLTASRINFSISTCFRRPLETVVGDRGEREAFFRFLKTTQTFTGDRSLPGFIKGIRDRAVAALTPEDLKALSHVIEWDRLDVSRP